ncbi:putative gustatory receptor clone PTE01 [Lethenteron reissneri]|uniref:putative gustatory receptor clone PTE01 n=1 Tax=Lethenteron reissneri TaxID=7753 RepID=UPI002AB77396|nr:putative gustatory receptor clone PTE01 [Lethenteron reissneri]
MENSSSFFYLSTFEASHEVILLIFSMCLPLYLITVLVNLLVLVVVATCAELHKPMYIFLCNLAIGDIIGSTSVVPKQLHIFLTRDKHILRVFCFAQMFWVNCFVSNEFFTLAAMSFDRYVAICSPLHYHAIVTTKRALLGSLLIWMVSVAIEIVINVLLKRLEFSEADEHVQGMFCDHAGILRLATSNTGVNEAYGTWVIASTVALPLCAIACSYYKIIQQCIRMKSSDFNRKTFYTLVTHFSALAICFSAVFICTLVPRIVKDFQSDFVRNLRCAFQISIFLVPIANVLIYVFRTKELRNATTRYFHKFVPNVNARFGSHKVWTDGELKKSTAVALPRTY